MTDTAYEDVNANTTVDAQLRSLFVLIAFVSKLSKQSPDFASLEAAWQDWPVCTLEARELKG